ncbi:MAG: hypothetical protein [Microvirus sp.]|nr:MAG: hypothetical protein [Microvirus sp.]
MSRFKQRKSFQKRNKRNKRRAKRLTNYGNSRGGIRL